MKKRRHSTDGLSDVKFILNRDNDFFGIHADLGLKIIRKLLFFFISQMTSFAWIVIGDKSEDSTLNIALAVIANCSFVVKKVKSNTLICHSLVQQ